MARKYVPENRRGKPIGVLCGKENPIPHIGISYRKGKRDRPAGDSCGGREKRVSMMIRIIEPMMFEQYLPGKCVRPKRPILRVAGYDVMAINRRTLESNCVPRVIVSILGRRANGTYRGLFCGYRQKSFPRLRTSERITDDTTKRCAIIGSDCRILQGI